MRLADLLAQRDFVVVAFFVKAFTGGCQTDRTLDALTKLARAK